MFQKSCFDSDVNDVFADEAAECVLPARCGGGGTALITSSASKCCVSVYEPGMSFLERSIESLDVRARISRAPLAASAARPSLFKTGV
jgi:hypothetical protein